VSPLEIAANLFNLISVFLANRKRVSTWWTGIIGTILFAVLFFQVKLYADFTLQFFFIATSCLGWWNWLRGGAEKDELPITRTNPFRLALDLFVALVVLVGYGYLLSKYTDASFPFVDSIVLVFSVLAQLLLMERKLENWLFWILVDAIAIPLFVWKELYLTAAIYAAFLINAVLGFRNWHKIYRSTQWQDTEEV